MFDLDDIKLGQEYLAPSGRRVKARKLMHWQKGSHRNDIPFDRVKCEYVDDGDTVTLSPELLRPAPPPISIPARGQLVFDFA